MIDEINRDLYVKLLSKLKSSKISKDYIDGPIVTMNSWDCYLYSTCFSYWQTYTFQCDPEREGYMIKFFPFTDYKISLDAQIPLDFMNDQFFNEHQKYIIPLEINKKNSEVFIDKRYNDTAVEKIEKSGLNPLDCIVTELYLKTEGNSLENFTEYLTCRLFVEEGYLVENQPIFSDINYDIQVKNPDFGAYSIPDVQELLKEYGVLNGGGFLSEISLYRIRGKDTRKRLKTSEVEQFVVGEAKTGSSGEGTFIPQAKNYYGKGFFHIFVQITPKYEPFEGWYDYVKFQTNGKISHIKAEQKRDIYREERGELMKDAIIQKIKFYLIQNLFLPELLELIGSMPKSLFNLNNRINNLKIEDILNFLDSVIK